MPYVLLHDHFPDVAERETRTITVLDGSNVGLPPGQYSFLEMFCDERGCDCRRVFFYVVSSRRNDVEAVITWGWESPEFYAKWMGNDDLQTIAELRGLALNLGSPETHLAPAILEVVRNVLLRDAAYVDRVKRHYAMFRQKIDGSRSVRNADKKGRNRRKRGEA